MQYPLKSLAIIFLKLGSVSFGGYMSLIAMVQDKLVYHEKIVTERVFNELLALALIMPGPVAVNLVTLIGFVLRGPIGALISFVSIIFPSYAGIMLLYFFYDKIGDYPVVNIFTSGVLITVTSVIFVAGIRMLKKQLNSKLLPLAIVGFISLFFFHAFWQIIILFVVSGLIGRFYSNNNMKYTKGNYNYSKNNLWMLLLVFPILVLVDEITFQNIYLDIVYTFTKVSLTLFGGGYVIIPLLQNIVTSKQWLTQKEFLDAIAMSQLCPGPILICSTVIGMKSAGFLGGLLATISIFAPSALLLIGVYEVLKNFIKSEQVKSISEGLSMAVISIVFYSAISVGLTQDISLGTIAIFTVATFLQLAYRINSGILIVSGGLINVFIFTFS